MAARSLSLLFATALTAGSAAAQRALPHRAASGTPLAPRGAGACAGGISYDDGSFENRYGLPGQGVVDLVQRFDLPEVPTPLQEVCVCLTRTAGSDGSLSLDLLVYAADGTASQPGTLLTGLGGLQVEDVPLFPQVGFYNIDLSALGITLAQPQVFIGPSWNASENEEVFLCGDEDGGAFRPVFASTDEGSSWSDLRGVYPDLDAVGVRARVAEGGGFTCVPDGDTLCLNDGRFQVRLEWRNNQGQLRDGRVVEGAGADDSGLFYFLDPDNWEMLVKVLDGCNINGHYWVFFAAVTTVEYTLTVTDSATGLPQSYDNDAGTPSPAVTDIRAFDACP